MLDYLYSLATDKKHGFIAGTLKVFLYLLSLIYGLAVIILRLFSHFRAKQLGCKVISVGNITLGGTGKTALVEFIARYLRQQGHRVAILSRGYKRPESEGRKQETKYENMGDEPFMLQKKLGDIPVIVDKNRIKAAQGAVEDYSVDTVILDDGFQQWRIKKDLEIVTIDATMPFGNLQLLPRGILREPLSSLRRADILVLTKTNLCPDTRKIKAFLQRVNPGALIMDSEHAALGFYNLSNSQELLPPDSFRGKKVTVFSGIGDPASFENLLKGLGLEIGLSLRFRDHYDYSREDLERIITASQGKGIDTIITTEKDAARICGLAVPRAEARILVLPIELKVTPDEQGFRNRLLKLYSA